MVNPSWSSFERPKQSHDEQIDFPENEQNNQDIIQSLGKDQSQGMQQQEIQEEKKPSWGEMKSPMTYQGEKDPTEEQGIFSYAIENIIGTASGIAEQYFGRYGNTEKMGKDILTNYPKSAGIIGWALSELMGPERWETMVKGPPGRQQLLPTSEELKDISRTMSKGYTKPKTEGQEKFRGFVEDVGATLSRRTPTQTARQIGINNILIPAAANVTKEIVEDLGFGKDKANMAKAAIWLPMSLAANVDARQFAANLMNTGRQGFNANTTANVPRYQNLLRTNSRQMLQADPRAELAIRQIAAIENDIANGQTTMPDLMRRYDAINAAKRDRGLFALNPGDRRAAIHNINQVRDVVREEIQTLGIANPQALQSWQNGVEAFAIIHRSNSITNWIESIAKGPYAKILTGPALALFGVGSWGAIKQPIIAGPMAAVTPAAYKTGQTIYRMWNNPHLAEYYWNAIGQSQSENIPVFISNYQKLNKEIEKSDSVKKKTKSKKN